MVKELIHDPIFLAQKSAPATKEDLQTAQDLVDTLMFHRQTCVGMAANMIGVSKCIIAFEDAGNISVLLNPVLLRSSGPYQTQESCLSLLGGPRPVTRYQKIKVQYQNESMQTRIRTFTGFTAQIVQHEMDHCAGVLI